MTHHLQKKTHQPQLQGLLGRNRMLAVVIFAQVDTYVLQSIVLIGWQHQKLSVLHYGPWRSQHAQRHQCCRQIQNSEDHSGCQSRQHCGH